MPLAGGRLSGEAERGVPGEPEGNTVDLQQSEEETRGAGGAGGGLTCGRGPRGPGAASWPEPPPAEGPPPESRSCASSELLEDQHNT